ncbi:MAG: hypothetical protein BIFFINMI_04101 [Phycisphaerae bacterium]|nr:hypothetical protein [Phycisphaerae bacterium]
MGAALSFTHTGRDTLVITLPPAAGLIAQVNYFDQVFRQSGTTGWILLLLSVAVTAWTCILLFACRRRTLCPPELYHALADRLQRGDAITARRALAEEPSVLARLADAGLAAELNDEPPDRVETAVAKAGADAYARWNWRIGYLAVAAAIAPMLGLLGTVIGMVEAFASRGIGDWSSQQGALAAAISKALITTLMGLVIAIPTLLVHAILRHRLGLIMLEASSRCDALLANFRLSRREKAELDRLVKPPPTHAATRSSP